MARIDDIDAFYKSWRELYVELSNWKPIYEKGSEVKDRWYRLRGLALIGFMLSIVPILPIGILLGAFGIGKLFPEFPIRDLTLSNFFIIWLISAGMMGLTLTISSKVYERIPKQRSNYINEPPERLNAEQMTFIFSYEAYSKLNDYLTVGLERNIRGSQIAFRNIFAEGKYGQFDIKSFLLGDEVDLIEPVIVPTPSIVRLLSVIANFRHAAAYCRWWKIDSETESIFSALMHMETKLRYRLDDKHELDKVRDILKHFSLFSFAYLNNHESQLTKNEIEELHHFGKVNLCLFTEKINALESYWPLSKGNVEHSDYPKATFIELLMRLHKENGVVRFIFGYFLSIVLLVITLNVLRLFWPVRPEDMATTIVTISFPVAIAYAKLVD